jgi:hypothetical protein
LLLLLRIEGLRIEGAPLPQQLMPPLFCLQVQRLVAPLTTQPLQIVMDSGPNLTLTPAKQGLGALTPKPAGGNRQAVMPGTHQFYPVGQGLGCLIRLE